MALTGDALAVFSILVGGVLSCAVSAVTAPKGWRALLLWGAAGLFAILSASFLIWQRSVDLAIAGPICYAAIPVLTVILVTVIVTRRTSQVVKVPVQEKNTQPGGVPDMSLRRAAEYVSGCIWASEHSPTPSRILTEMRDKLYLRQLTAFGRREPQGPPEPILWKSWPAYTLDPKTGSALSADGAPAFYDIQFDGSYVRRVWPSSNSWMI